ncbi:hypothetical protein QAD02_016707 [Eretmocerus hayati]|uniref:Uncharacterized protein n=1 Tax=Eretmocerus hayati TaxID=131215 RepID=A0ACC2PBD1_9HYME|nr:hypothetical protein QAD02_016707 [Eretmocerus hayati]
MYFFSTDFVTVFSPFIGEKIKYDPLWRGPMDIQRSKTDSPLRISFGIFLGFWFLIGLYSYSAGNMNKILHEVERDVHNSRNEWEQSVHSNVAPLLAARFIAVKFTALSAVLSLSYIILLRWFAKHIVYTAVFSVCTMLLMAALACLIGYAEDNTRTDIFGLLMFFVITFLVVIIFFLILRKKIVIACEVIKESSKALMFFPSLLFFPIIQFLMYLGVVTFAGSVCFSLLTVPSLPNGQTPAHIYVFHLINIFGFLWLGGFFRAFIQMILSGSYATWYWTLHKKYVPNNTVIRFIGTTARYHVGTLAFGSLILATCQALRIFLKFLRKRLEGSCNPLFCCCFNWYQYFFANLERFVTFLNRNAYVMSAVHGTEFIQSAKNAFNLLMRNIVSVVVINRVTAMIFFLGQCLAIGISLAGTAAQCKSEGLQDDAVPYAIGMVFLGSILISEALFMVLGVAIDTIFLCVMEDYERNDGSDEKPYYMTLKLKTLLLQ